MEWVIHQKVFAGNMPFSEDGGSEQVVTHEAITYRSERRGQNRCVRLRNLSSSSGTIHLEYTGQKHIIYGLPLLHHH